MGDRPSTTSRTMDCVLRGRAWAVLGKPKRPLLLVAHGGLREVNGNEMFVRFHRGREGRVREQAGARSPSEPAEGSQSGVQTYPASKDLSGGASGILRPVTRLNRPRQNSHDRSSIHPG